MPWSCRGLPSRPVRQGHAGCCNLLSSSRRPMATSNPPATGTAPPTAAPMTLPRLNAPVLPENAIPDGTMAKTVKVSRQHWRWSCLCKRRIVDRLLSAPRLADHGKTVGHMARMGHLRLREDLRSGARVVLDIMTPPRIRRGGTLNSQPASRFPDLACLSASIRIESPRR